MGIFETLWRLPAKVRSRRNAELADEQVTALANAGLKPLLRIAKEKSRDISRIEEELSDALTAQVEIRVKKRTKRGEQGEVAIQFGSLDELNGLIDKLRAGR